MDGRTDISANPKFIIFWGREGPRAATPRQIGAYGARERPPVGLSPVFVHLQTPGSVNGDFPSHLVAIGQEMPKIQELTCFVPSTMTALAYETSYFCGGNFSLPNTTEYTQR